MTGVSYSQPALLTGILSSTGIFIDGRDYANRPAQSAESTRRPGDEMHQVWVSPSFFRTLGIQRLDGRTFSDRDDAEAPGVAIINRAAARTYFAGARAIGRRYGRDIEKRTETEIVGVVADAKYESIRGDAPPTVYRPYLQRCCSSVVFEVRTGPDPSSTIQSIRGTVRRVDPGLPLLNVTTQTEQMDVRLAQKRLFAAACALFSALALLLASIGLFGLMSYTVARRTNEIGIRMALGADARQVMVMQESLTMVAAGVALGLSAALAAGRLVASLLYGLSPADPATIAMAIVTMSVVAGIAGFLPARRAAQVEPMTALRRE